MVLSARTKWISIFTVGLVMGMWWYLSSYAPQRAAREAVSHGLNDPAAAQFRGLEVYDDAVCGEVNTKNKVGAFVGFERFYFVRSTKEMEIADKGRSTSDASEALRFMVKLEDFYDRLSEICSN